MYDCQNEPLNFHSWIMPPEVGMGVLTHVSSDLLLCGHFRLGPPNNGEWDLHRLFPLDNGGRMVAPVIEGVRGAAKSSTKQ